MKPVLCAAVWAACALPAFAQEASPPTGRPEPKVEQLVTEDDNARIEELRVRGQTQRIVVHPKKGGAPYEILPADASREASGRRVWHVLRF